MPPINPSKRRGRVTIIPIINGAVEISNHMRDTTIIPMVGTLLRKLIIEIIKIFKVEENQANAVREAPNKKEIKKEKTPRNRVEKIIFQVFSSFEISKKARKVEIIPGMSSSLLIK
jgi:hypothetical protein